jgi:hypothetical protein
MLESIFFRKSRRLCDIMCKSMVSMCFAYWMTKTKYKYLLLLYHSNNCYANAPQCHIYTYIAYLVLCVCVCVYARASARETIRLSRHILCALSRSTSVSVSAVLPIYHLRHVTVQIGSQTLYFILSCERV